MPGGLGRLRLDQALAVVLVRFWLWLDRRSAIRPGRPLHLPVRKQRDCWRRTRGSWRTRGRTAATTATFAEDDGLVFTFRLVRLAREAVREQDVMPLAVRDHHVGVHDEGFRHLIAFQLRDVLVVDRLASERWILECVVLRSPVSAKSIQA